MPRSPREPLPPALKAIPFTVAQGLSLGLGTGRLRGPDLERPFHGIRVPVQPSEQMQGLREDASVRGDWPETVPTWPRPSPAAAAEAREQELVDRCTALAVALPAGAFFSHLTAARLWPLPLPGARDEPVHVSVRRPQRPPRRSHVAGHVIVDPRANVLYRRGLPVVDPVTLFCQLATHLSLPDLVAVGDALVLEPVIPDMWEDRPWVPLRQLVDRVEVWRGRGKRNADQAVSLIRPGAESRPETLVRLAIRHSALPEPEVNVTIRDARGRFIGRGDLVYRQWRVIVEYDGEQHRTDTRQFDRDVARLDDFAAHGWRVIRIVGRSFFGNPAESMERVRRALVAAGWRP